MGHKDTKYRKSLNQQAYVKLVSMQAFDENEAEAIANGTAENKIFSVYTYKTYWEHIKYFLKYIKANHPEITTLKKARRYIPEWLQSRLDQNLPTQTIQIEAKALAKLYGIKQGDKDYLAFFETRKEIIENIFDEGKKPLQKNIQEIIKEVSEDICDNFCKYRDTADEDNLCTIIRAGKSCPLDRLQ